MSAHTQTHVVLVTYGVVPNQVFAFSCDKGAETLAKDAKQLGYRDARVVTMDSYREHIEAQKRRYQSADR